jgi:hypothetical protein
MPISSQAFWVQTSWKVQRLSRKGVGEGSPLRSASPLTALQKGDDIVRYHSESRGLLTFVRLGAKITCTT